MRVRVGRLDFADHGRDAGHQPLVLPKQPLLVVAVHVAGEVRLRRLVHHDAVERGLVQVGGGGVVVVGAGEDGERQAQPCARVGHVVGMEANLKAQPSPIPAHQVHQQPVFVFEIPVERGFGGAHALGQLLERELLEADFVYQPDALANQAATQVGGLRVAQVQFFVEVDAELRVHAVWNRGWTPKDEGFTSAAERRAARRAVYSPCPSEKARWPSIKYRCSVLMMYR